ncbi:glycyl-radical enzyme activating protein [Aeoliella sp. ICT_H6.2]|uniref:Glycyl-radical enzyme activating protein n=1 Tax=Aeoliella straminimaris TaxID=2954799 RepID=A0A9X2JJ87_9BACT|nr:glycyl-radical enzyme activating protein [Aeoliella straminimaris]MCO6046483.1 glycyl-radical enzyme activating protein [Aeoliella straminimaris]
MPNIYGNVFNIQRYSVKDGPGIRTTVFLKGCPLRCWWCHNPESQAKGTELAINPAVCVSCGKCWSACPHNSPLAECPGPLNDREHCTVCGECVEVCPTGGRNLLGDRQSVAEVMAEVAKDRLFFEESGGGVTVSGGEPLMQTDFVHALLLACREQAIPTAVDTCGYCDQQALISIAPVTDLFLYDLKAMDDAVHREHTGVSNVRILDNLVALGRVHTNVWIRIPVVTGVNDSTAELEAMAQFVSTIHGIQRVDLLSYHPLGSHKHERIGKSSSSHTATAPTNETMQHAAELFQSFGINEVYVT